MNLVRPSKIIVYDIAKLTRTSEATGKPYTRYTVRWKLGSQYKKKVFKNKADATALHKKLSTAAKDPLSQWGEDGMPFDAGQTLVVDYVYSWFWMEKPQRQWRSSSVSSVVEGLESLIIASLGKVPKLQPKKWEELLTYIRWTFSHRDTGELLPSTWAQSYLTQHSASLGTLNSIIEEVAYLLGMRRTPLKGTALVPFYSTVPLGTSARKRHLTIANDVIHSAVLSGYLDSNPLDRVRKVKAKVVRAGDVLVPTREQLDDVVKHLPAEYQPYVSMAI